MELYNETHKVIKAIRNRFKIYHEVPCDEDDRRVQEIIGIVIQTIEALPSADVVPKSEVEKLKADVEVWKQNRFNIYQKLECYKMTRAKVAREIMQEVRQALMNMVLKNAMGENYDLEKRFAEIEKKYTEGKE